MGAQQVKERSSGGGGGGGGVGGGPSSSLGAGSSIRSSRNKSRVPKDSRILGSNIFTEHSGKYPFWMLILSMWSYLHYLPMFNRKSIDDIVTYVTMIYYMLFVPAYKIHSKVKHPLHLVWACSIRPADAEREGHCSFHSWPVYLYVHISEECSERSLCCVEESSVVLFLHRHHTASTSVIGTYLLQNNYNNNKPAGKRKIGTYPPYGTLLGPIQIKHALFVRGTRYTTQWCCNISRSSSSGRDGVRLSITQACILPSCRYWWGSDKT